MQLNLNRPLCWLLGCALMWAAASQASSELPTMDWRATDANGFSQALARFDEAHEPADLVAVRQGLAELQRRVDAGELRYAGLVLAYTKSSALLERIAQRRQDRAVSIDPASIKDDAAVSAAARQVLAALGSMPDEPALLQSALSEQLWASEAQWLQWATRYVSLVPTAWPERLSLLRHRVRAGDFDDARAGAIELLDAGVPDSESLGIVLLELALWFGTENSGCADLAKQLAELQPVVMDPALFDANTNRARAALLAGNCSRSPVPAGP